MTPGLDAAVRRLRQLCGDQRGAASTELAVATPLLLLLILLIAQFGLWTHATHIAQTAASRGLAATRTTDGSSSDGRAQLATVLDQLGGGALQHPQVSVHRGAAQSRVDITGQVVSVVPFLHLPVRATAVGPTERLTSPETR